MTAPVLGDGAAGTLHETSERPGIRDQALALAGHLVG
jgi:hypothetical protein